MSLLLGLFAPGVAQATCPLDPSDLRRSLDSAYAAYTELDFDGFRAEFGAARDEVPCLAGTLDAEHVADLHFAYALDAFLDRDQDRMLRAVRGVLTADPDFEPAEDVARPGSGLYVAFELASQPRGAITETLPEGRWVVDGSPGADAVPLDRNALVQRVDADPITTWYVDSSTLPPALAHGAEAPPLVATPERRRSRGLLGAGIGLGIASGAALGTAAFLKDRYYDEEDPPADPSSVRTMNHAAGISGWVLAAGAAGLGAGAVIAWEW